MREFSPLFFIKKQLAELAMFFFLLTVAPVYAMSQIEGREFERSAIVQVVTPRTRNRALNRRYPSTRSFDSYIMIGV